MILKIRVKYWGHILLREDTLDYVVLGLFCDTAVRSTVNEFIQCQGLLTIRAGYILRLAAQGLKITHSTNL
jgi:hypothetical protein